MTEISFRAPVDGADVALSFDDVMLALLGGERRLLRWPLVAGIAALVVAMLIPPTYRATARILVSETTGPSMPTGLAGLARQLGFDIPRTAELAPDFYNSLMKSRSLNERLVTSKFLPTGAKDSLTLLDVLEVKQANNVALRVYLGLKKVEGARSSTVEPITGALNINFDARDPNIAAQVVQRYVDLINDFNNHRRSFQSREKRRFIERRFAEATLELREAEDSLIAFYERNRTLIASPTLRAVETRLARVVSTKQAVAIALATAREESRIAEANDVPVLTLIDPPVPPVRKSAPNRTAIVLVTVLLAFCAALLTVLVSLSRQVRRPGFQPATSADVAAAWLRATHWVRRSPRAS